MKLIIGLGNPGKKYENNRHNIGFMAVEKFRLDHNFPPFQAEQKFDAMISSGEINDEKVILALPLTFMNNSGFAVQKIVHWHKLKPGDCITVCDDLDTAFGKIRIRKNGGPGTHNGLKSIDAHLGNVYARIKIGIENRSETESKTDTAGYVLGDFNKNEKKLLPVLLEQTSTVLELIVLENIDEAMNKYN